MAGHNQARIYSTIRNSTLLQKVYTPGTLTRANSSLNFKHMKKHEKLGQGLDRDQQRQVTGGAARQNAYLYCRMSPELAYFFVSAHFSNATCVVERNRICSPTPPDYHDCYCTGNAAMLCGM